MKDYTEFCYDFLLGDHFAKVSNEALIYYIALNFNATNGFVANPLRVLDSLGFCRTVFDELVANEEIITQPDRSEIFITAYFIHNPGFKPGSWLSSPFAPYWLGKLNTKSNRIAKFNPEGKKPKNNDDPLAVIQEPKIDSPFKWDSNMVSKAIYLKQKESRGEELTEDESIILNEWKRINNLQ